MRFNCGLTRAEKRIRRVKRLEQWHAWFAWRPIRVSSTQCIWLEFIERKGRIHYGYETWWEWDYRVYQRLED